MASSRPQPSFRRSEGSRARRDHSRSQTARREVAHVLNNTVASRPRREVEKETTLVKHLTLAVTFLLCISFPTSLTAAKVEVEGKAWLDSQKDAAEINVNGAWDSEEWGAFHLIQAQGSREVSGNGGGYEITGVVSGKRLFMLFSEKHTVEYCAT